MKRNYVTPVIAVETFSVTQSIAACVTKINSLDSLCVLNDSDGEGAMWDWALDGWFAPGHCESEWTAGMDSNDGICYHTSVNQTFAS